uniref:Major facilitator superfamily (MFS) profile domain-containing protein n=1 Tax=Timema genevievae TaxID=629358 RepID=A0A7R9JZ79_TIMGE|nr:unnamed protein product [Timema genevievae]
MITFRNSPMTSLVLTDSSQLTSDSQHLGIYLSEVTADKHRFLQIIWFGFDWVGDDDWKPALGQSLFFVGSVIGTLGLGVMADHIGRLPVLVLANLLALVGNLATAFTSGLPQFASCRLLAGLATDSNFLMMYILAYVNILVSVMEYMRPNMRTLGLNLCIGVFYSLGCVVVPWVAVLTMNWRHFLLVVSTPLVVVPAYYLLVPESARWLINKGRTDEAVTCFLRIAKFNGRNIPSSVIDTFKSQRRVENAAVSTHLYNKLHSTGRTEVPGREQ